MSLERLGQVGVHLDWRPRSAGRSEKTTVPVRDQTLILRIERLPVSSSSCRLTDAAVAASGEVSRSIERRGSTYAWMTALTAVTASAVAPSSRWALALAETASAVASTRPAATTRTVTSMEGISQRRGGRATRPDRCARSTGAAGGVVIIRVLGSRVM